jgi:pre-mRNA-splicing factor CWC26
MTKRHHDKEDRGGVPSHTSLDDPSSLATVYRDKKTGKKIDLILERLQKEQEEQKKIEHQEKYMEWGKGLVQKQEKEIQRRQLEESKVMPLNIYANDEKLNQDLKQKIRWGDPMAHAIKKPLSNAPSSSSSSSLDRSNVTDSSSIVYVKPKYKGPPPLPNRYNIMPGYRWDGVDRSNGYERRLFQYQARKNHEQQLAYQWSVEDM